MIEKEKIGSLSKVSTSSAQRAVMVQELLNGSDVNLQDDEGLTALHKAIIAENIELAIGLLEAGANPNLQDNIEQTALHFAVSKGQTELVSALLDKGAYVNFQNRYKQTALHCAAADGQTEIVSVLVDKGANINHYDFFKQTALHLAAVNGRTEVVLFLVEKNADVNVQDADGLTALDCVGYHTDGKTNVVEETLALLNAGVKVLSKENSNGVFNSKHPLKAKLIEDFPQLSENKRSVIYSSSSFFRDTVPMPDSINNLITGYVGTKVTKEDLEDLQQTSIPQ